MNVTPDSFSDGGNFFSPGRAIGHAVALLDEGADVVEVGGESTRPGATPVPPDEEIERIIPVISGIRAIRSSARVAVDTVKAPVARAALAAGASVVNDVSALRLDPALGAVCAAAGATLVLMHSRGTVADMARYDHATYDTEWDGVMRAVVRELRDAASVALDAGVARERIVLDPGIGFSKRSEHSILTLAQLPDLVELGFPVMVGASRKRFVGEITGVGVPAERDAGSVGAHVAALVGGATWFRVHAVRMHREALDVAAAILDARHSAGTTSTTSAG